MRLTLFGKIDRVMRLLVGLRAPAIATALVSHGFDEAAIDDGFRLLRALVPDVSKVVLPAKGPRPEDAPAWAEKWLPIVRAALRRHFPAVEQWMFHREEVLGSSAVGRIVKFLAAYDGLRKRFPKDAAAVRALLARRGLTDAVVAEGRSALVLPPSASVVPAVDVARAEKALWGWYAEWAPIVRAEVKNKRLRRELGLAGGDGGEDEEPLEEAPAEAPKAKARSKRRARR